MLKLIKSFITKVLLFYIIFLGNVAKSMIKPGEVHPQTINQETSITQLSTNKASITKHKLENALEYKSTLPQSSYQKNQILKIKRQDNSFYNKAIFKKQFYRIKNAFYSLSRKNNRKKKLYKIEEKENTTTDSKTDQTNIHLNYINDSCNDTNNSTANLGNNIIKRNSLYQVHKYIQGMLSDTNPLTIQGKNNDDLLNEVSIDDFFCVVVENEDRKSLVLSYYQPEVYDTQNELLYSNHYLAKVNDFFKYFFVDSNIKYIGYYAPYYLMRQADDMEDPLSVNQEYKDGEDYVHISLIIKQSIITKMINQIGRAIHQKMEIPLHNHYITGIYLAVNVFTKLQLIFLYDKDIMHNIGFIEDYNKASKFMLSIYNKNIKHSNYCLLDFYNMQKNTLSQFCDRILSFTNEDICGVILIKIKMLEEYFVDLAKLRFVLYRFASSIPKEQKTNDGIYQYNGYYIAIITFFIANYQYTKYYKIEEASDDIGSDLFVLFTDYKLQELINNEQHSMELENVNFAIMISLMFSYSKPLVSMESNEHKQSSINNHMSQLSNISTDNYLNDQDLYNIPPSAINQPMYDIPPSAINQPMYDIPPSAINQPMYDIPPSAINQPVYDIPPSAINQPVYDIPPSAVIKNNLVSMEEITNTQINHYRANKMMLGNSISEIKNVESFLKNTDDIFKITMPLFLIFNVNKKDK
jgi:hypothetical protein